MPQVIQLASVNAGPNTVTFTLTGIDAVGVRNFLCSFDAAPFVSCSSTQSYPGIRAGGHIFEASAVDQGGNRDKTPAKWAAPNPVAFFTHRCLCLKVWFRMLE
jgi:hypothetical protein